MKSTIGIFETHRKAVEAVEELQKAGIPMTHLSMLGRADLIDDHIHMRSNETLRDTPVVIGTILGTLAGILTGVGFISIPGLGFLYHTGPLIGAFSGFDIGLVTGGLFSLLAMAWIRKDFAVKYREHLKFNRFLVIDQGEADEVEHAKMILHSQGDQMELTCH